MKKIIILISLVLLSACKKETELDLKQFKDYTSLSQKLHYLGEYGHVFEYDELELALLKEGLKLEVEEVDTYTLGLNEYIAKVDGVEYKFSVDVQDTVFPEIDGKQEFTIYRGDLLNLDEHIFAQDPVEGKLEISYSNFNNKRIGRQIVIASAVDSNGNESEYEIIVNVKRKPFFLFRRDIILGFDD